MTRLRQGTSVRAMAALVLLICLLVLLSFEIIRGAFVTDMLSMTMSGDEKLGLFTSNREALLFIGSDWTGSSAWSYSVEGPQDLAVAEGNIIIAWTRPRTLGGWRPAPKYSARNGTNFSFLGFSYMNVRGSVCLLRLSLWWPEAFLVAVTLLLLVRAFKRHRSVEGRCRNCGYDLRGNPIRCSECGRPVETNSGSVTV